MKAAPVWIESGELARDKENGLEIAIILTQSLATSNMTSRLSGRFRRGDMKHERRVLQVAFDCAVVGAG